jgi:O-antigen/teichoic acid export membrane protein
LPVAGLSLLLAGFEPTRVDTANRHLLLGRVTALDLLANAIGIGAMLVLAFLTGSVWSLAAGWVVTSAARLALLTLFLPGHRNRLHWESAAGSELLNFGFWIFLSSVCGFLVAQGDKAILGKFLSIDGLGVYNIGTFLATFPLMLGSAITARILIPLYREHPDGSDVEARKRLIRMRYYLTGGLLACLSFLSLAGPWIVDFLYDDRYRVAGGVIVAICAAQMIAVVSLTYDQAALAGGDSRGFFVASAAKAVLQTTGFLIGAKMLGLAGAIVGLAVAMLVFYPVIVWLALGHRAWDKRHDLLFLPAALLLGAFAVWLNWNDVILLIPGSGGALHVK